MKKTKAPIPSKKAVFLRFYSEEDMSITLLDASKLPSDLFNIEEFISEAEPEDLVLEGDWDRFAQGSSLMDAVRMAKAAEALGYEIDPDDIVIAE